MVFAGLVGLADEILDTLAVDGERGAPGKEPGGDVSGLANDGLTDPEAEIEIERLHGCSPLSSQFAPGPRVFDFAQVAL